MLQTKFRVNRSTGSDLFTIYGRGGHLCHENRMPRINFHSPYPWRHHTDFGFDWLSSFGDDV